MDRMHRFRVAQMSCPSLDSSGDSIFWIESSLGVSILAKAALDHPEEVERFSLEAVTEYTLCRGNASAVVRCDPGMRDSPRLCIVHFGEGVESRIVGIPSLVCTRIYGAIGESRSVLVGALGGDGDLEHLYELDTSNGLWCEAWHNEAGYSQWLVDDLGVVHGGVREQQDGSVLISCDGVGETLHVPPPEALNVKVLRVCRDGTLWISRTVKGHSVVEHHGAAVETAFETEELAFFSDMAFNPAEEPLTVTVHATRASTIPCSLEGRRLCELVRSDLGRDVDFRLLSLGPSGRYAALFLSDVEAPSIAVVCLDGESVVFRPQRSVSVVRPWRCRGFEFVARDGLAMNGYLTGELGESGLVVNIHGGPWARNEWAYDAECQWLCDLGFACLQVNFRGSVGVGGMVSEAGVRQWGRAMQTDLIDAVEHCRRRGWVTSEEFGLFGWSYGGFAAILGSLCWPEVKFAVAISPPVNLVSMLEGMPRSWSAIRYRLAYFIGDAQAEPGCLEEISPAVLVKDECVESFCPMFIARGADDARVSVTDVDRFLEDAAARGWECEGYRHEGGHGLGSAGDSARMYSVIEEFIASAIGGRATIGK
ncbi:Dipeptidyl aminopeptidase BIII [Aestuariimicrobium sp. T2.26MG-19.2B]|nr:Dipeptidyl aminopeptidase BIII [Aestuariimicrobium sp. T2.26MG-19.2B]